MLNDCLSGAEGARNRGHAALGDRKQGVDHSLTGDQRLVRSELLRVRPLAADRPLLDQRDLHLGSVFLFQNRNRIGHLEVAFFDRLQRSFRVRRNHDLLGNDVRLLHGSQNIAADDVIARLCRRNEMPHLLPAQRRNLDAARQQIGIRLLHDIYERPLDTVIDTSDQSGPEFHAQRRSCRLYRLTRSQPRSLLINLNGCLIPMDLDDFSDQSSVRDTAHIEHVRVTHACRYDKRSGHLLDCSLCHTLCLSLFFLFFRLIRFA